VVDVGEEEGRREEGRAGERLGVSVWREKASRAKSE
jgi:hypothetical protein